MFSTRSHSPAAPATEAPVLIVSHGSPSEPDPQEVFVRTLAARVAAASGRMVRGATLAKEGALATALEGLEAPVIFPHFMADGWFVSTNLPRRLAAAGAQDWQMAEPLGLNAALPGLALERLRASPVGAGFLAASTLVVAAHGSPSDPRPAKATEGFAQALRRSGAVREVRVGYVDEEPSLVEAARVRGPATVLPFFAARAGHVLMDLPDALEEAGFNGAVLDPIGTWAEIPALIAAQLPRRCAVAAE